MKELQILLFNKEDRTMSIKKEDWKPLTFDEACERVRQTRITEEMTYEERLEMLKRRYGV